MKKGEENSLTEKERERENLLSKNKIGKKN